MFFIELDVNIDEAISLGSTYETIINERRQVWVARIPTKGEILLLDVSGTLYDEKRGESEHYYFVYKAEVEEVVLNCYLSKREFFQNEKQAAFVKLNFKEAHSYWIPEGVHYFYDNYNNNDDYNNDDDDDE